VPKYSQSLDRMFHALGDGSRRALIERLVRGPATVSELAAPFDMALPTVLQHLGVLEAAAIVTSTKLGRVRTYQLAVDALTPAAAWIGEQQLPAERRLDRLGAYLSRPAGSSTTDTSTTDTSTTDTSTTDTSTTDTSTTDKEREAHVRAHRTQPNPRDVRHRT
jgi:DNA-binding transcriptional ArsR family regulator